MQGKDASMKKSTTPKQRVVHQTGKHSSSPTAHSSASKDGVRTRAPVARMAPVANMVAQPAGSDFPLGANSSPLNAAMQRDVAERASLLLDPALFLDITDKTARQSQALCPVTPTPSFSPAKDARASIRTGLSERTEHQHPTNTSDIAPEPGIGPGPLELKGNFEQPASSLVSPPASSHNDFSNSPNSQCDPSNPFLEQCSPQSEHMQNRYTPESGPMRRASSGSCNEVAPEQAAHLETIKPPLGSKPTMVPQTVCMADEESLRLIKELQAQELGLRRRGKA